MLRGIRLAQNGGIQKRITNEEGCQKREGTFKKGEWQSFERKKIAFKKISEKSIQKKYKKYHNF